MYIRTPRTTLAATVPYHLPVALLDALSTTKGAFRKAKIADYHRQQSQMADNIALKLTDKVGENTLILWRLKTIPFAAVADVPISTIASDAQPNTARLPPTTKMSVHHRYRR